MIFRVLATLFSCFLLAMCSALPKAPQLSLGMTETQVEMLYGPPLVKNRRASGESWSYDFRYITKSYESVNTGPADTGVAMDRTNMPNNFTASTSMITTTHTERGTVDFSSAGQVVAMSRGTPVRTR